MALFRGRKEFFSKYTTRPSGFTYDVFLSFRGEDTRKNFTDHLYTALVNAGLHTFRDDPELERGENIKENLQKAIQQSRSSVIVFSKDYTSSRWCLDELVMILKRKRTSDHVVLPVFYEVHPSLVRKQAESLAKVYRYKFSERLNEWRTALREVADLAGMVLADGHESSFIQNIVEVVQDKLVCVPLTDVQEVLEKKLLFINPVLDDVEGKPVYHPIVKAWLIELKEAVFDIEDLLQEIKTEVLRRKMEPESGSCTSKVQELNSSLLPSHAFESALVYPRVEQVLDRLDSITERRKDGLDLETSGGYRVSQTLPSTSLVEDSGVCGRDNEKETLIKLLLSDDETGNKISVIPIVGMGGIGKTTLAQLLYNDVRVEHYFDIQAWVCVAEKFDVLRISQQIYESLTSDACDIMNLDLLQSKLKAALIGKRIFLVLDDVWNKNYTEWEVLRRPFQFGAQGSKIIVTTRNQDVACMVSTLEAHRLMPMSEEDGWSLFEKHAFKNAGIGEHSHLEEIGRQIVRKCNGLPLAIKSLGGLLCSKLILSEWETILNSDMWELSPDESEILPSLWLSYKHLPPHLRHCFVYCSIFPKNYAFKTSELVYLWKAEDLLQPKKNRTAEEIGQDYFNDLVSRSFFQLSSSSDQYFMHDLINDLASFVSGEFCLRLEGSECESPNILKKTRHFSYVPVYDDEADDRLEMFVALKQAKCLRTFLTLEPHYGWWKLSCKGLYDLLPELLCLRVLRLSWHYIDELPDSINNLKHLRYLDLSSTPIERLPDTICTLYNLQALLLSNCDYLTELPANLGRLINLSHLDLEATKLEKMPPYMGNLKDLQLLPEFVLDKSTADDNLPELKKLQNLRGKLRISGLVHSSSLEAYILRDKKFLTELILEWGGNRSTKKEVLEKLQPHLNLERLTIRGYGGKMFPSWPGYYYSSALVYLELVGCVNCISLPPLGQLPSLTELHISGLHRVVSIGSEFYYDGGNTPTSARKPFRSLRYLNFYNMGGWKEWSYVGTFPNLLKLVLSQCRKLAGRLALDSFPMLKELDLSKTNLSLDSEISSLNKLRLKWCGNIATFLDGGLHAPNLTKLRIDGCENFSSWPEKMHSLLPSLVDLLLWFCQDLECFPEGGLPSNLKSLVIVGCKKLSAKSMQNLNKGLRTLTSLEMLTLDWFAEDEEEGWLPSTLTYLQIYRLKCKETINSAKWFGHLNSLQELVIDECSVLRCMSASELPSSLQTLKIWNCSALECLPGCLPTSLRTLEILYCHSLRCFPENELPSSLSRLNIYGCALLEKRGQGETGEDYIGSPTSSP